MRLAGPAPVWPPGVGWGPPAVVLALALLGEELIYSGVIQRVGERALADAGRPRWLVASGAAAAAIGLRLVAGAVLAGRLPTPGALAFPIAACCARALTGRVGAAWVTRLAAVALPTIF